MTDRTQETRFICDRMVGSVCRYLRLMGYDTFSANDLPPEIEKRIPTS
ncbi:MAG: Mut7-C RNAse domain-containing protein [Methanobacteriota archaeon]